VEMGKWVPGCPLGVVWLLFPMSADSKGGVFDFLISQLFYSSEGAKVNL
jgi:hypothetical protein